MTTELTKAAQQALERLKIHRSSNYCNACEAEDEEAISALERALTQRPAAQTEREAFEARVVAEAGEGAIAKWLGTDGYENTRVQDYRLGWVWCLEWQARASLPTQPAAQATHETVKFSHAGHFYNLVAHALMEVKRPDACAHRLRLILDELAALMGQPATPEPVGEPDTVPLDALHAAERERDYWKTRARAMLDHAEGTCWYWMGDGEDHLESLVSSLPVVIRADQLRELLARPAPGVPEGAREALERIASWNEHPAMLGVDYGSNGVRDYYRKIASDALAAAQAKGGEHD